MIGPDDALVAQIDAAVSRLPFAQAMGLAERIAPLVGPTPAGRADAAAAYPTPAFKGVVTELWRAWEANAEVSGPALALALKAAAGAAERMRATQSMDIVWTGPSSAPVPVRMSSEVLLDLIERTRNDLILVSFAAYRADSVVDALRAAADRGVDIRLVLETTEDGDGRLTRDAAEAFTPLTGIVSFWTWPREKRPEAGASMHVKTAVADGHTALVTSANLTGAALDRNMELGLVVTGGSVPKRLRDHFRALMAEGVLERSGN